MNKMILLLIALITINLHALKPTHEVTKNVFSCYELKHFKIALKMLKNNDKDVSNFIVNYCKMFKKGEKVVIVNTKGEYVKLGRRQHGFDNKWTKHYALKRFFKEL